ncbi:hypothetical protein LXL04_019103 [Taraxacum kok-saghyz]
MVAADMAVAHGNSGVGFSGDHYTTEVGHGEVVAMMLIPRVLLVLNGPVFGHVLSKLGNIFKKGVIMYSTLKKSVGIGGSTSFWHYSWLGGITLCKKIVTLRIGGRIHKASGIGRD